MCNKEGRILLSKGFLPGRTSLSKNSLSKFDITKGLFIAGFALTPTPISSGSSLPRVERVYSQVHSVSRRLPYRENEGVLCHDRIDIIGSPPDLVLRGYNGLWPSHIPSNGARTYVRVVKGPDRSPK